MSSAALYEPEWIWDGATLRHGALAVDSTGQVEVADRLPPSTSRISLPGRLMLPGLVNAHSHAFQRLLRGRTEYAESSRPHEDFWTWREQMYDVASRLTPEGLYLASRQAFLEMALAGITTVGEFHYLQHAPDGRPYAQGSLLAREVIRAARDVGLRIVLLRVGYARAGFNKALDPRQRRFIDTSPDAWLDAAFNLASEVADDPLVRVGLAPHSVRALPRDWLEALLDAPDASLHMHVAEQPAEVAACEAEHGQRPVQLLESLGLLGRHFTAVHAIHLSDEEVMMLGRSGAGVCACPTTERNLGDGIVCADALQKAGVPISLGSDGQSSIDLLEEASALEGHQRLARGRRNVLDPGTGQTDGLAKRLLGYATRGGALSLGLDTGFLLPGHAADFFTVDLRHSTLVGSTVESVLASLLAGGVSKAVREVAVQGSLIVREGQHPSSEATGQDFARVVKEVFS